MTCDHVIIIDRGRLAAAGSLADLARQAGNQGCVVVTVEGDVDAAPVRQMDGVTDVAATTSAGATRLRITAAGAEALAPRLYALAVERGWKVRELVVERQTLEELFVRLTSPDEVRATAPESEPAPAMPGSFTV